MIKEYTHKKFTNPQNIIWIKTNTSMVVKKVLIPLEGK